MLAMPWPVPGCCVRADPLPEAVDVAVVGGSLAGLTAARLLAEGGARVALVAEGPLGGFSLAAPGIIQQDLGEHPHRLLSAVGLDEARAMHRFLVENRELLRAEGCFSQTGSLTVAAMDHEGDELVDGFSACEQVGLSAELCAADDVCARLSAVGFGPGRLQPGDGVVEAGALVEAAVEGARAAGAALCAGLSVFGVEETGGGNRLLLDAGALQADVVVLAGGHRLSECWPWFADKLYPVRHQWVATAAVAEGRLPLPVSAQHGFSTWRQLDGRVVAGGARFASPHLQIGETDAVLDERVDHVLRANLGRFFPDLVDVPIEFGWAAIATHTCDGLPILGPLPGRVDLVACTGFHGLDQALALRAGQVVAEGLLTGKAPAIPQTFAARRMV